MSTLPIQTLFPHASSLVYGCMGLGGSWSDEPYQSTHVKQAQQVIDCALDNGINFFDHADIYTFGKAEQVFGHALAQRNDREQMIIQSKCGIRFDDNLGPKRYDLSAKWIKHSVDNSLAQLNCDYLDILLLHRPDPLMDVNEIAQTYLSLKQAGKVKHLGVSNMQQYQMQALVNAIGEPLAVNQIEMSLQQHSFVDEGVYAGNQAGSDINFAPGMLEYCQAEKVQIQSWGSLCQGQYTGAATEQASQAIHQTSKLVAKLASEYGVSAEAILLAWLMRHPSNIQPVIGTTNLARIKACTEVNKLQLSREHWYALYVSGKGVELP
ncbi:aldo/keto reductase [Shewanella sp. WXL01]|uniref:aldo/keto reductase n=1 Tax=Shewanella sp. WXL01 TaxID=2709721 RepID=UPI00143868C0|nr:aldo/keto reductase [Shewanella sp. WXL01]NKF50867.1 aldo/keto reductase [Shewanella sp. WXL01]